MNYEQYIVSYSGFAYFLRSYFYFYTHDFNFVIGIDLIIDT